MKYSYSSEEDKLLFSKILNLNIRLLVGKNNGYLEDKLNQEFFRNLDYLNIYNWKTKERVFKKGVHGETKFSTNGHTGINMYGNGGYVGDPTYIFKLFSHEIWHALITILNSLYGDRTGVTLKVKNQDLVVNNYSGFFLCRSKNDEFMVGYLLAEVMADILSHIVYELNNDEKYDVDDAFNYKIDDNTLDAPYDDFLTLVQLFIASFSLDAKFSFGDSVHSGKGVMNHYIDLTSKRSLANKFINGMLVDPLSTMDEYDKYMGMGEYINLLWDLDLVYSDYVKTKKMNIKSLNSISDRLNIFVNRRLSDYLKEEKLDENAYKVLINNFNELLDVFREEIRSYEVKTNYKGIKNILKKLRR